MKIKLPTGKEINVSDKIIDNYMQKLDLTKEEAVQLYCEDEGYITNAEQEALCQKAKENKITQTIHGAQAYDPSKKKTQKERCQKANPTKEMVIANMAKTLKEMGANNIEIVNKGKLITFTLSGKDFKLDLIQSRTKK